ncbi:DUF2303 family protein [Rivihabitans pingtungensis]|uniref:DUF2303 family protein n=1 Tax=Rivihabitans pingtungensis TaxID=1054498 RepID=UPI00235562E1|nr:DUF2303 family protein [Rivihabitans pingtungensis]MCK6435996.1 YfdQ family protein [Rivihabitans pingtungensis]
MTKHDYTLADSIDPPTHVNDIAALVRAPEHMPVPARALADGQLPAIAVPTGYSIEYPDTKALAALLPTPLRKTGTIHLHDTASFVDYVNAQSGNGQATNAVIYCDTQYDHGRTVITAVFNDHHPMTSGGTPGHRDHRAVFAPRPSVEWSAWKGQSDQKMSQVEFAGWIEQNLGDIVAVDGMPDGSAMLAMATNMEINMDNRLKSTVRLQSGGQELVFVDREDENTQQRMKLFEKFSLGLNPFFEGSRSLTEDGKPVIYRVDVRLRYRQENNKVAFWYELIRPDKVLKAATEAEIAAIKTHTNLPVMFGHPN